MESRTFHQRADASQHRTGGGGHRRAQQRDITGRRGDQAEKHPDRGGLARAVRTQEAVDRTLGTSRSMRSTAIWRRNRLVSPLVTMGAESADADFTC